MRARASPDFIFSFYYRHMLPADLLALAPAYNMHGSLLPKYRGRAPTNWAVLHGETETGATLHEMTAKPDAGAIVAQTRGADPARRHRLEVFDKVTVAAEQTLWRVLPALLAGNAPRLPNDLRQGQLLRRPQAGGRPHRLVAAGAAGLQPAPRGRAALSRRVHRPRRRSASSSRGRGLQPAAPAAAPGARAWPWSDNAIFGVCGDGRALAIATPAGRRRSRSPRPSCRRQLASSLNPTRHS